MVTQTCTTEGNTGEHEEVRKLNLLDGKYKNDLLYGNTMNSPPEQTFR